MAWLNVDKPRAKPNYHVVLRTPGPVDHDFYGLTPERIKALGEHLLAVHAQLVAAEVGA